MLLQKGLTKENFFNGMHKKYPLACDHFCKWIDEYKKAVDWESLFGEYLERGDLKPYKFHDIPCALQLGVFLTYVDSFDDPSEYLRAMVEDESITKDLSGMIACFFAINEEAFSTNED